MTRSTDGGRRVVITGAGVVSPVGNDVPSTWEALLAGRPGGGTITLFETTDEYPTRIACEVKGFEPDQYMDRKEVRRYDRFAQFALAASHQAMGSAGLDGVPAGTAPERFGVIIGSGIGGIATFEEQCRILFERGPSRISPFFVPMYIPDIAAGLASIRWGLQGPNYATVSACASSAHAIGESFRLIQQGHADLMLSGGSEAAITPMSIAGFAAMKAMSTRNGEGERASRPFDATRDGFVIGEGAGMVVLERLEHALDRGAQVIAEVVGYGISADAYHITQPAPEGAGAQLAMRLALEDAGIEVSEVGYINAHGTSTPHNDRTETAAIKAVFGESAYEMVVGSTKSMTGHLLGAAGGLEAVVTALVCRDGAIPPTINFATPDPDCDLEYAHGGRIDRPVEIALTNSFGFGGHNVTLALRRFEG